MSKFCEPAFNLIEMTMIEQQSTVEQLDHGGRVHDRGQSILALTHRRRPHLDRLLFYRSRHI